MSLLFGLDDVITLVGAEVTSWMKNIGLDSNDTVYLISTDVKTALYRAEQLSQKGTNLPYVAISRTEAEMVVEPHTVKVSSDDKDIVVYVCDVDVEYEVLYIIEGREQAEDALSIVFLRSDELKLPITHSFEVDSQEYEVSLQSFLGDPTSIEYTQTNDTLDDQISSGRLHAIMIPIKVKTQLYMLADTGPVNKIVTNYEV